MAEVAFRPARQLSEYKGKGASASRELNNSMLHYFCFMHQSAASPWGPLPGHPRAFVELVRYLLPKGVGENITFVHRDCTPGSRP